MSAQIIDGKAVATEVKQQLTKEISQLASQGYRPPGLAVILVGNDSASQIYVNKKRQSCADIGMHSTAYDLPNSVTEDELLYLISELNKNPEIDGILVQLPLPAHIDTTTIVEAIAPHKDVDGFHPYSLGRLAQRQPLLRPCTPYGIITLLNWYQLPIKGQHAVIIGASNIVGRPMTLELLLAAATTTTCHRFSEDLQSHVQQADILITATGKRGLINSEWIKPGATVIDVGIHRLPDGSLCGDLEFATAQQRAGWITPVPGGVGPMTVITLMRNTLFAAKRFAYKLTTP